MKRKDIQVGTEYVSARAQDWRTYRYGNSRVRIVDAGEWYDDSAGSTWYRNRPENDKQVTLADGTAVRQGVMRRKTNAREKATHVWAIALDEETGEVQKEAKPFGVALTRLKTTWAEYAEMVRRADESKREHAKLRDEANAALIEKITEAQNDIKQFQGQQVLDNLPTWVLEEPRIFSGRVDGGKGDISITVLATLLAAAYADGHAVGKEQSRPGWDR